MLLSHVFELLDVMDFEESPVFATVFADISLSRCQGSFDSSVDVPSQALVYFFLVCLEGFQLLSLKSIYLLGFPSFVWVVTHQVISLSKF